MIDDQTERAWWVFLLPAATCYTPANDEETARRQLVDSCYKGAPVASWPCIGSRWVSRAALTAERLRPRTSPDQSKVGGG